jgi:hypothetical protein
MVNHSIDHLPYKSSTNHKEDIIKAHLHELKIAYQILAQCDHCRNKFVRTVKEGLTTHQNPEVLKNHELYRTPDR